MVERWIVNASPMIILCNVQHEHLLLDLADEIVVPQVVVQEIQAGPENDRARLMLSKNLLPIVDTPLSSEIAAWGLGAGETAVLSHALTRPEWVSIIDDRAARKCAAAFSLPFKGTLAVVILAKMRGIIPSAAEILRTLKIKGFHLNDGVVAEALAQTTGETWEL